MNVIVANTQQNILANLDIDIIKSITGTYEANELVEMFKNFFYNKMVLDVTAMKDYTDIRSYQTLAMGLDVEKIIFFLPENSSLCTSNFLSKLISVGIYNFTTNLDGIKYLIRKSNTYKDVAHIQQLNDLSTTIVSKVENDGTKIIGVRNVTEHAGATTLIYMLKKELTVELGDVVVAIEVDKNDFVVFNDKNMVSTSSNQLRSIIDRYRNASIILIDLNDSTDDSICGDVLYLLEPSIIKLNKLIRRNHTIFSKLKGKKLILNKSLLSNKDITDFEYETNAKVFYNMPPLDERKRNGVISDFLGRIGLLSKVEEKKGNSNKIFGMFRR